MSAATFTVTNTADSGPGSLRQAILDANVNPAADTIVFAIPASDPGCAANGVCTIAPATDLPAILDAVTIDGTTQAGATVNTLAQGTNAVIKIVLSGAADATIEPTGLRVGADDTTIRGLAIGGFVYGVAPEFDTGFKLYGCFIGTDASGEAATGNTRGLLCTTADHLTVGGTAPADRNLISGNPGFGIVLQDCAAAVVQGNLVGTDAAGTAALGNGEGIVATSFEAVSLLLGGSAPAAGNVISGNTQDGLTISLLPGDTVIVQGNLIGTDAGGVLPLGNALTGIRVSTSFSMIGGIGNGEGNVVANNGTSGVIVDPGTVHVTIRGNSIYGNGFGTFPLLDGIDLGSDGVTANDEGDADAGANGLQNFPIVSSATTPASGGTEVQGVLHSTPSTTFDLDFYSNPACLSHPHDFLQGRTYIGSVQLTTDGAGTVAFDVGVKTAIEPGERVSATATGPLGDTSEFSQRPVFSVSPTSGPAGGGTALSVAGTDLLPGAQVQVGGVPATGVAVTDFNDLTASTPKLQPGSVNDITVTEPDGTSGTLEAAYVADFLDVPPSHPFYSYVTTLVANRISAGIGGGDYGMTMPTLRQQMAVFLLKSRHGLCYTPPHCSGLFDDVPCPSPFADWIEALSNEGITGGCGNGNFCPTSPVLRQQMAVFVLKGEHGPGYLPPPCTGLFGDVACPSSFADWIEQLSAENVTVGCGGGFYCPLAASTRGQLAVFIVKTSLTF